jgi:CRISPR/Cas system CSM-associated protein Csm4 (group 5 of RAMP superfamily)
MYVDTEKMTSALHKYPKTIFSAFQIHYIALGSRKRTLETLPKWDTFSLNSLLLLHNNTYDWPSLTLEWSFNEMIGIFNNFQMKGL